MKKQMAVLGTGSGDGRSNVPQSYDLQGPDSAGPAAEPGGGPRAQAWRRRGDACVLS